MDKALKERILGAIVLVALVVLVVPVFLDGPPDNGEIISERVPLPGQDDQKSQTVVLERSRDEPMPSQQEPASETPGEEPAVTIAKSEPARVPERQPEPQKPGPEPQSESAPMSAPESADSSPVVVPEVPGSSTGMFAVQLGSFSNQQNAERLAAELRKQGFAAFLSQLSTGDGQLHRVRVGPQKDREAAEAMAVRLARAGHKGRVLPHP